MKVDTVSTSILLLFLVGHLAASTIAPSTVPPETTVAPPVTTKAPEPTTTTSTKKPETTTTLNPNIKLLEETEITKFMANSNGHRDKHMIGRFAFFWTWDDTLVDSAISRIVDTCEPKIDNSDEIREVILSKEDFRLIRRDRKTLNQKMVGITYEAGVARVGCVGRVNCQNSPLGDTFYFCHFAPSNFTKDPDFKTGKREGCQYHGTYSSLCQDVPDKAPEYVTAAPARIIYRDKASAEMNVLVLGMVTVLVYGFWE